MSLSVHAAVDWHLRGVISTVVSRRGGVVQGSQNGIIVETDSKQYNVICFFWMYLILSNFFWC